MDHIGEEEDEDGGCEDEDEDCIGKHVGFLSRL